MTSTSVIPDIYVGRCLETKFHVWENTDELVETLCNYGAALKVFWITSYLVYPRCFVVFDAEEDMTAYILKYGKDM